MRQNILDKTNYYCKIGDVESLKKNISEYNFTDLQLFDFATSGVIVGNLDVVKYLIEEVGVDVSREEFGLFRWAAGNKQLEILKYLYDNFDIDPTTKNNYALKYAIENRSLPVIKYLIEDLEVKVTTSILTVVLNDLFSNFMCVDIALYFMTNSNFIKLIINNYMFTQLTPRLKFILALKFGLKSEKELKEYISAM